MFRKTCSIVLIFNLMIIGFIPPRILYAQDIKEYTIAVLNLTAQGISQSEADFLSEHLYSQVTRVISSDNFKKSTPINYTVIERSQMDKIFDQFDIQNTGCTDIACAVEFGKMLSTERIIIGSVGLVGKTYSITTRIVDVETSTTLRVADYTYVGPIDDLLTTGIGNVVDELMFGKKKSRKRLYIISAAVISAGILGYVLTKSDDSGEPKSETGSIIYSIPVPEE
ncbi:hypothetical protein ACFL1R_12750 [Candidatus Latescibacterota bacterium]